MEYVPAALIGLAVLVVGVAAWRRFKSAKDRAALWDRIKQSSAFDRE